MSKDNKDIEKFSFGLFFLTFAIILIWIDYGFIDFDKLKVSEADEYAFHGSLIRMHDGLIGLSLRGIFDFSQYTYGFPFFLINVVAAFPFLGETGSELAIFIPRVITSIFAIFSLKIIVDVIGIGDAKLVHKLLVALFVVSFSGYWTNATWMHPDFMMISFILLSHYSLSLGSYYRSIIWFAIALSVKFQAILFVPVIVGYLLIKNWGSSTLFQIIKIAIKTFVIVIVIYLILNPHLMHPVGFDAWMDDMSYNILSNMTNHGKSSVPSLGEKLLVFDVFFFPSVLFLFLLVYSLFVFVKRKKNQLTSVHLASIYIISNSLYFALFVNKAMVHYYLPLAIFSVFVLYDAVCSISANIKKYKINVIVLLLAITIFNLMLSLPQLKEIFQLRVLNSSTIENTFDGAAEDFPSEKRLTDIMDLVDPFYKKGDVILISNNIAFPLRRMSLDFDEVHIIYGVLNEKKHLKDNRDNYLHKGMRYQKPKYILLSKDDTYFDLEKISQMFDSDKYTESSKMINEWINGKGSYQLIDQNEKYYLFTLSS